MKQWLRSPQLEERGCKCKGGAVNHYRWCLKHNSPAQGDHHHCSAEGNAPLGSASAYIGFGVQCPGVTKAPKPSRDCSAPAQGPSSMPAAPTLPTFLLGAFQLLGLRGKIMIRAEENHSKPASCNVLRQATCLKFSLHTILPLR